MDKLSITQRQTDKEINIQRDTQSKKISSVRMGDNNKHEKNTWTRNTNI